MTLTWPEFRRERRRSRQAWALLAAAALAVVAGLGWFFTAGQFAAVEPPADGPREAPVLAAGWMKPVPAVRPVPRGPAAALLDTLPVKGRAGLDNYDRSAFGQAWLDVDRNGCDTRNDILRRDLSGAEFTEDSSCRVAGGTFREPYTGRQITFRRGAGSSTAVQIDHVVALGDAWQKGAQQLTAGATRAPGERSAEPDRRRRSRQPGQERLRRRHLASAEQGLPLPLCCPADLRQGRLPAVGHARGEGRDAQRSSPPAPGSRRLSRLPSRVAQPMDTGARDAGAWSPRYGTGRGRPSPGRRTLRCRPPGSSPAPPRAGPGRCRRQRRP